MRGRAYQRKRALERLGWRVVDERAEGGRHRLILRGLAGEERAFEAATRPRAFWHAEKTLRREAKQAEGQPGG